MKLVEALNQHLIRLVPKKETSDYPQPYSQVKKWEKWQDHLGEDMVLVNIARKFIFFGRQDLIKMHDKGRSILQNTLSFPDKKKAIAYIGDHEITDLPYKIKANDWMKVTLTKKLLDTEINVVDHLDLGTMRLTHALHLIINDRIEALSPEDLIGVICYPETYRVLADDHLREIIQTARNEINDEGLYGDLIEIMSHRTERSRLLLEERRLGIEKPESFDDFGSSKILKQGTIFKVKDE